MSQQQEESKKLQEMAQKIEREDAESQKFTEAKGQIAKIFQDNKNGEARMRAIISRIKPLLSEKQFSEMENSLQEFSREEDENVFVENVFFMVKPILELKKESDEKTVAKRHGFTE